MTLQSWLVVVTASLAATVCIGQIRFDEATPYRPSLINDLPTKLPSTESRFQVIALTNRTLLLDATSGDTWVLTEDAKQEGMLTWIEVPRIRRQEKADISEPEPNGNSPSGESDIHNPFE